MLSNEDCQVSSTGLPATAPLDGTLLHTLLLDQQDLAAATRFSQWHDQATETHVAANYSALMPAGLPSVGEQYAFEVDLQVCTGCKACVTACHSLNGLDEHETWRSVGLLQAANTSLPMLQHVTTACHHCVDPACLRGCPTMAYEKDPVTGIVRHLDDQCFGCQYCILMCPYEVPSYSATRGIVRKCDMCSQRLAKQEAPACVQGCPNGAIAIRVVSQLEMQLRAQSATFLPTAPAPDLTTPTTTYRHQELLLDVVAGDHEQFEPAHPHWPLIWMLVLTQMSIGVLVVAFIIGQCFNEPPHAHIQAVLTIAAALLGFLGTQLALLHLGRPLQAYRAWLGWRTSWLSREVLAFGAYVPLLLGAAIANCSPEFSYRQLIIAIAAALAISVGVVALYCSAMVYIATGRGCWARATTFARFAFTGSVLGCTTGTAVSAAILRSEGGSAWSHYQYPLLTLSASVLLGIWRWCSDHRHRTAARHSPDISVRGSARLLASDLKSVDFCHRAGAVVGSLLLPMIVVTLIVACPGSAHQAVTGLCALQLPIVFASEIAGRYLFFASSVSSRMPGALLR